MFKKLSKEDLRGIFISIVLSIFFIYLFPQRTYAQGLFPGLGATTPVVDTEVTRGDIVCVYPDGVARCKEAYSQSMYAVVADITAAAFEDMTEPDQPIIISTGRGVVRVTAANGNITRGDFVTTSDAPGIGQKADRSGYVLGVALEDYTPTDSNEIGELSITINIHFESRLGSSRANLLEVLRQGLSAPLLEPLSSLRYILAALLVVSSFVLGFGYYGKIAQRGVEALGRNPLAAKMIQRSVYLHIIIVISIFALGLFSAYLILIL